MPFIKQKQFSKLAYNSYLLKRVTDDSSLPLIFYVALAHKTMDHQNGNSIASVKSLHFLKKFYFFSSVTLSCIASMFLYITQVKLRLFGSIGTAPFFSFFFQKFHN